MAFPEPIRRAEWVFGLIVEEYRCLTPGCAMPGMG